MTGRNHHRIGIRSASRLSAGYRRIEITTAYAEPRPAGPLDINLAADGSHVASGPVPVNAPPLFTANDCLDFGVCLGGRVSLDYYDRAPFPFNGQIHHVNVRYAS